VRVLTFDVNVEELATREFELPKDLALEEWRAVLPSDVHGGVRHRRHC